MRGVKIAACPLGSSQLVALEQLYQSQWADFSFLSYDSKLPLPLVALFNKRVIGGLAYTFYSAPDDTADAIWINALFVAPGFRGQGVASQLVERANEELSVTNHKRLLAYTHIPEFYETLGWSEIKSDSEPNHKVMALKLIARPKQGNELNI